MVKLVISWKESSIAKKKFVERYVVCMGNTKSVEQIEMIGC